jgi:hypothetical protein
VLSCLSAGADRGDALPQDWTVRGVPSFLYLAECACARLVRAGASNASTHLSSFPERLRQEMVEGTVRGREVREVEAGLVRHGRERLSRPRFRWAATNWAILSNSYVRAFMVPRLYNPTTSVPYLYLIIYLDDLDLDQRGTSNLSIYVTRVFFDRIR